MKKISKIISMCLICVLAIAGAITGLFLMNKKPNNEDPSVIEPVNIYYATAEENTGAALAAEEKKGGAHYVGKGSLLELTSGLTRGQEANYGGAIYIDNGGRFVLNGGTISYNKSKDAAAIYVEAGATLIIGDNVVIQNNGYVEFDEYVVNYYVDGVLSNSVVQGAPVVNIDNVGKNSEGEKIDYTMCNGFFTDTTYIVPLEEGETVPLTLSEGSAQTVTASTAERNVYTLIATPEKLSFTEVDEGYSVKGVEGITGGVVVPQQYKAEGEDEAADVIELEDSAFMSSGITSLYINTNITIISEGCCADSQIESINITENITGIRYCAFELCGFLGKLRISKSVEYIDTPVLINTGGVELTVDADNPIYDSRDNCNIIVETATNKAIAITTYEDLINMPNTIKIIGASACMDIYGLDGIDKLEIPEGIEEIESSAFSTAYSIPSVTSVVLPQSLKSIENYVFETWRNLSELTIKSGLTSVERSAFVNSQDYFLPIKTLNIDMVTIPDSTFNFPTLETLTIGDNAKTISADAFKDCAALNEVIVGKGVTSVDSAAFTGCDAVKDMFVYCNLSSYANLPCGSVETLTFDVAKDYPSTLAQLAKCKTIIVGDLVKRITSQMFQNNKVLENITIGYGIKLISSFAFRYCSNLKTVNMPTGAENKTSSLTQLGQGAFTDCVSLTEMTLPGTITTISMQTFNGCSSLKEVTLEEGMATIPTTAFLNCSSLTTVNMPTTLTTINERAFEGCVSLETITIPETITTLGAKTFNGCTKLKTVNIEEGIEIIPANMFANCSALTEVVARESASDNPNGIANKVVLPTTITEIGATVFTGCEALMSVTIPASVTSLEVSSIRGADNLKYLSVQAGNSVYYDGSRFSGSNGVSGRNIILTEIYDDEGYSTGEYSVYLGANNAVIPKNSSITQIGRYAFYYKHITSINIPANITLIGLSSFQYCDKLTNLTFDNPAVTSTNGLELEAHAFRDCSSLTSVSFPDRMRIIRPYSFLGTKITSVDLSACSILRIIGKDAFDTSVLTSFIIHNGGTYCADSIDVNDWLEAANDYITVCEVSFYVHEWWLWQSSEIGYDIEPYYSVRVTDTYDGYETYLEEQGITEYDIIDHYYENYFLDYVERDLWDGGTWSSLNSVAFLEAIWEEGLYLVRGNVS